MKTLLLLSIGFLTSQFSFAQYYNTTIKTPTNVTINALVVTEYAATTLQTLEADAASWRSQHGSNAVQVAPATATYNCHAFAWHIKMVEIQYGSMLTLPMTTIMTPKN